MNKKIIVALVLPAYPHTITAAETPQQARAPIQDVIPDHAALRDRFRRHSNCTDWHGIRRLQFQGPSAFVTISF